jgi:anti-anti-sigma factor
MRRHGAFEPAGPADAHDHASWGYRTAAERAAAVCGWLGAGLAAGFRGLYVADADPDQLLSELAAIPDADGAVARGALVVMPSSAAYDLSGPIDPVAQLAMYAGATDQALADGYAGLRVAADITALVLDTSRRASHLGWEQYADRYIATHPLAPLCLYDKTRVHGVEAIACVHALQGPARPAVAVFAADGARRVQGEIDSYLAPMIADVLREIPDEEMVLDLRGVEFIDARSAWTLHRVLARMRDAGRPLRLVGTSPALELVWTTCGFDETLPLPS